ncbi:hypothetical protein [Rubellimicrobium sp. CFH 75288]|uniref:hypothetical protein n=1 Tax=Rubellimicrobium sp. CFH 75288 TaxID=2697034 RepID=UPI0014123246|nr:hypothetical protein [Rubellimicrobium sp. CFH 75288]NAZ35808.1 hypothetical protein [Rubellimicrobium sp. CFH 75288]
MTLTRPVLVLTALALAGLAYAWRARPGEIGATPSPHHPIRDAGRDQMRLKPLEWDRHDEALDETFPASDPATRY